MRRTLRNIGVRPFTIISCAGVVTPTVRRFADESVPSKKPRENCFPSRRGRCLFETNVDDGHNRSVDRTNTDANRNVSVVYTNASCLGLTIHQHGVRGIGRANGVTGLRNRNLLDSCQIRISDSALPFRTVRPFTGGNFVRGLYSAAIGRIETVRQSFIVGTDIVLRTTRTVRAF